MFQWDAVDTNPDLEGQNVIKSFEMAIRHNRRTTRTELQSFFVAGFILTDVLKYFSGFLMGGASAPIRAPRPLRIRHWLQQASDPRRREMEFERTFAGCLRAAGRSRRRRESCRSLGLIEDSRRTAGRTERKHRMPADVD